jgi:hypothetical protein
VCLWPWHCDGRAEYLVVDGPHTAGVGAAWRWQGPGGGGFDSLVVKQMQRFLASNQPRVRILGGTRQVIV